MNRKKHLLALCICVAGLGEICGAAAAQEGNMEIHTEQAADAAAGRDNTRMAVMSHTTQAAADTAERDMDRELAEGAQIQREILEGKDCITLYRDVLLQEPIRIPAGRTVTVEAADGAKVTIRRSRDFDGSFFETGQDAALNLGRTEHHEGLLILDCTGAKSGDGGLKRLLMEGNGFVRIGSEVRILEKSGEEIILADAGTALVTVTKDGEDTGTKGVSFFAPNGSAKYRAVYEVADQELESGMAIAEMKVPPYAKGIRGEEVKGTLLWSLEEGGEALPEDLLLSGSAGDTMELYWTFYPADAAYGVLTGSVTVTFREPAVKENGITNLNISDMEGGWESGTPNTGNLSSDASAQGTTAGEGIVWEDGEAPATTETDAEEAAEETKEAAEEETDTKETEEKPGEGSKGQDREAAGAYADGETARIPGREMEPETEEEAHTQGQNPDTGDAKDPLSWIVMLAAAFLVSTARILSLIMGKVN